MTVLVFSLCQFAARHTARAEVAVFSDNFNAYTAGSALPATVGSGAWAYSSNASPFQTFVQVDANNLFGEGVANNYLAMAVTAPSANAFLAAINPVGTAFPAGSLSFTFYQPQIAGATGDGLVLRIGNNIGNGSTAFGLEFKNGSLYLSSGSGVNAVANPMALYPTDQLHSFTVYFNNASGTPYFYTVDGIVYRVAAGTMDVWMDNAQVGAGLGASGGLTPGTNLNSFNFTSKANFVGALYVDNVVLRTLTAASPSIPPAPSVAVAGGQAALSWPAVSGASVYTVARAGVSGGPYTVIGTSLTNSYVDYAAATGSNFYVVAATNLSDTGSFSNESTASVTAPTAKPGAVTNLTATVPAGTPSGQINLSWTAPTGSNYATNYQVKRQLGGGSWVNVANYITGTTFADTPLPSGTTYNYVVYAQNSIGQAAASSTATATTLTEAQVMADGFDTYPAGAALPTSGSGVWSTATNTAPFQALVTQDTGNLFGKGTANNYLKMAVTAQSSTNYFVADNNVSPVVSDGSVSFRFVQPTVSGATGDGFILRLGSTGGNAATAFSLALKNGGLYQVTGDSVALNASPFATYSLDHVHTLVIYYNNNSIKQYQYNVGGTAYTLFAQTMDVWLDGAQVNFTYPGGVQTKLYLGKSGSLGADVSLANLNFTTKANFVGALYVDDLVEKAIPVTVPAAPSSLYVQSESGNRTTVAWTAVAGAIGYTVSRSTVSGGPYTVVAPWVTGGATSYTDTVPASGTYYYVVNAVNTFWPGTYSGQVAATTAAPDAAPPAVAGLTTVGRTGQVVLNWNAATGAAYATGYNVKRGTTPGGPYATTVASNVSATNYVDTTVAANTAYYYVVTGVNSQGEGAASAQAPVATAPVPGGMVSFAGDWGTDPALGKWSFIQANAVQINGVSVPRLQADPVMVTAHGLAAARVEVRPGDNPIRSSGERSEVLTMKGASGAIYETSGTGTVYYGLSYYIPANWQSSFVSPNTGWCTGFQLHGPDALIASPALSMSISSAFQFVINGGDLDGPYKGSYSSSTSQIYNFTDNGPLNPGTWTDFVIEVTYSANPDGAVTIWRRNQGQLFFNKVLAVTGVPTLQYRSQTPNLATPGNHYWKEGLYRGPYNATLTSVLWDGPTSRATTFAAAEWQAFGTEDGPVAGD